MICCQCTLSLSIAWIQVQHSHICVDPVVNAHTSACSSIAKLHVTNGQMQEANFTLTDACITASSLCTCLQCMLCFVIPALFAPWWKHAVKPFWLLLQKCCFSLSIFNTYLMASHLDGIFANFSCSRCKEECHCCAH